jgi:hypothetical protein
MAGSTSDLSSESDLAASDLGGMQDMAMTDANVADLSMPDLQTVDLSMPDLLMPDLAMPDLAMPDLVPPPPLCQTVSVSTLSGSGTAGFFDGTSATTKFNNPSAVAADSSGNVYVADVTNERVRKVSSGGSTSTVTGNGTSGFVDGTGGPTGTTEFQFPVGVAVDSAGNVYVADLGNNRIRKVASDGSATTLAGNGTGGFFDGTGGGTGTTEFNHPNSVAVDANGNVFVADNLNNRVRKVAANGATTTLAGNGTAGSVDGTGGPAGSTEINGPVGVAVDSAGYVYVSTSDNRIRKISPTGTTSTLAGNGTAGYVDGTGGASGTTEFNSPQGVAVDGAGNVYVAEFTNNVIRRVAPDGTTNTLAGDGTAEIKEGVGCTAQFNNPEGVALLGKLLFVGDTTNQRIRQIQLP